jgi:Fur family ferric uptake transcriptional regulator
VTESPRIEALEFRDVDEVAAAIRAAGGRLSTARRLVLEALFDARAPLSAEAITARLADAGHALEAASIYRNLESLEALGAIKHFHLGHGPGLYSLVGGGEREFLVCERCNRVVSLDSGELEPIRNQVRKRFGYEARFTHFPITGLCPDCATAERDT